VGFVTCECFGNCVDVLAICVLVLRNEKRSSSVGSEKVERVGDRQGQMERFCSTGQSPQRAVAPTEEVYLYLLCFCIVSFMYVYSYLLLV
jgi:hypothetical protein